ncbi:hypothetical protein NIIDMKKI_08630 [Mycobacterium kansasii]|uniref:Mammalian cell entry C-terminal domain-containing protein n=1 Tax=Mycobacterium kansasii TaxID=1768 RepID=A0A7G1I3Q6_MYCKA|nr:hypothetical protein NIIDMKKI_08630 [Mycobacterium kansasii]
MTAISNSSTVPGPPRCCLPGRDPLDRTAPALDLDLLLGGLKPVIQGLNPQDVNALTASLVQVFQGEGGTLQSLLSKTSSFSNTLADNNETVQQLIDNLNTVVATLDKDGDKFSTALDRLQRLVSAFSDDRNTIGTAIDALDQGTASIADLLTGPGRRWPARWISSTGWRRCLTRTRTRSTFRWRSCPTTTASWCGWAPTVPGFRTTSAS